ncbi:MAG: hypothetical protein HZC41_03505 [Chloroflexi bacterium]|nr:hypothetical protein [Chloroflexota bacterium]
MDRISAAGNLIIEMKPESWRLIANGGGQEQVLVEAAPGQPLRYVPVFAQKRRLPDTGALSSDQIQRVVLGWSNQDESWHLGLLLGSELASVRGSRWCEIARWPDPDTSVFGEMATQAGRSLASALGRSFNFIEPQPGAVEAPPPPPLPALPLHLDDWTLEQAKMLQFRRSGKWARARVIRIIWYTLLIVVYVALSLLTLQGQIALPKPEFLPYLGLAVAALLALGIIYTLFQLLLTPNRIIVDAATRQITARAGSRQRWRLQPAEYQAVYVSQTLAKRSGADGASVFSYGELNVLLTNGKFKYLLDVSERFKSSEMVPTRSDLLVELKQETVHTDLQAAAMYVAQALAVPCWYDRRGH